MADQQDVYLNYIDGQWKPGRSGRWEVNRNPARPSQILGKITQSNELDIRDAVDAAERAQKEWAKKPRPQRAAVLLKAAHVIQNRLESFAKALTLEEGKNLSESRGEIQKTVNVLEFIGSEGRRPTGQVIPSEMTGTFIYTTRAPLGVVGVITPWNFPVCIPAWKIGPALLEGNAVLFKPASLTPNCAVLLTRAFEEAGLPKGLLNLLFGIGAVVGNAIVKDPRVRAISFTGSNEVGRGLYTEAAKGLKRVQMEMGGKNPLIVLEDADLDLAVDATVMGAFGSSGQRCTATSRVIIHESVHAAFREKLLFKTRSLKVGDGLAHPQAMGPLVDEKQMTTVLEMIQQARDSGCNLICGGERVGMEGYFVAPTVFDDVKPDSKLAREEVFGPVLALIPVRSFEEAVQVANAVEYGLSSSVYTRDIQRVMQYADRIETGMLHVNSPTVGGEAQAPFGGVKATGLGGREMGSTGPEFFCEIKTVYVDYNTTTRAGNVY
jgi:alpha-ketoglutaric semialdehyde dehydrogenase